MSFFVVPKIFLGVSQHNVLRFPYSLKNLSLKFVHFRKK